VHPDDLRTGHSPQPLSTADLDQLDSGAGQAPKPLSTADLDQLDRGTLPR
jgi:hypothetical protein